MEERNHDKSKKSSGFRKNDVDNEKSKLFKLIANVRKKSASLGFEQFVLKFIREVI